MKKVIHKILVGIIMMFLSILLYILWDNQRIIIVDQQIEMYGLPPELDGFTILQISDLHEREFGNHQERILKKINHIDYDVIVFTGDMLRRPDSMNDRSFYTLLEGIENKENVLYVQGNEDPPNYEITDILEKSEFVKGMEERGARLLESFETIFVEGVPIHFVNFEMAIMNHPDKIGQLDGVVRDVHAEDPQYQAYQSKLWKEMMIKGILNTDDTLLSLNHYPVSDMRFEYIKQDPNTSMRAFDLMIAGHYHGGQIRLPLLGALFIPDPWYERNGFFPPQDRVKGLWEYDGVKQYVSAGLGSSRAIPFLNFRLFNTPEINKIILTSE